MTSTKTGKKRGISSRGNSAQGDDRRPDKSGSRNCGAETGTTVTRRQAGERPSCRGASVRAVGFSTIELEGQT